MCCKQIQITVGLLCFMKFAVKFDIGVWLRLVERCALGLVSCRIQQKKLCKWVGGFYSHVQVSEQSDIKFA